MALASRPQAVRSANSCAVNPKLLRSVSNAKISLDEIGNGDIPPAANLSFSSIKSVPIFVRSEPRLASND
jgi:hypothetical protein